MTKKHQIENQLLREKLDKLLKIARRNEQTQTSFDDFTLSVVAAEDPKILFQLILEEQKKFRIDDIQLCLIDHSHEVERLLTENYQHNYVGLSFIDKKTSELLIPDIPDRPVLGKRILKKYSWIININELNKYRSAGLMPLSRGSKTIGIMLLLSEDPQRYLKSDGTTFLHKLSAMIAISIESCINRQRIVEIGYRDGLTNAYNRRYFDKHLKHKTTRFLDEKIDLVCLFIDIDFFKRVNDNHGHQVGDEVLVKLVALMHEHVGSKGIVARYGGEEFAILLSDMDTQQAYEFSENIRILVEEKIFFINNSSLDITISIGLASLSQIRDQTDKSESDSLDKLLLNKADEALYQAKNTGRNKVIINQQ